MRVMIGSFAVILLLAQPVRAQGLTVRMSGDVVIPIGTEQDGSVVTMDGRIQVDGTLQGDAMTMNGDIAVAGTVAGSVRTFNGSILLRPTARVDGDVWAVNGRVDRQPGAQGGGRIGVGLVFTRPRAPAFLRPRASSGRWMSEAVYRSPCGCAVR